MDPNFFLIPPCVSGDPVCGADDISGEGEYTKSNWKDEERTKRNHGGRKHESI